MAQIGDTVRYLSSTGGGKITRMDGKTAWVAEENGFEMPMPVSELVVVLPAGSKPQGAKLMFDQKAFDDGRAQRRPAPGQKLPKDITPEPKPAPAPPKAPDTPHGNRLNISLAFEPMNIRDLARSAFNIVLVNDSNYTLGFALMRAAEDDREWSLVYAGTAEPNELTDLACPAHDELNGYHRVALQYFAYKPGKPFAMKTPASVARRLDLTKFFKLHCFRPGLYFTSPVLELKLVSDDEPETPLRLAEATGEVSTSASPSDKRLVRELGNKYRVDRNRSRQRHTDPAANPNRLLPPVEIDLHINQLTDTTAGMSNADMLTMQLDTVQATMENHRRRIGQKIIFIHGKGNGVLRRAILDLLHKRYPTAEIQDASFAEYGFGATLVTIHQQ